MSTPLSMLLLAAVGCSSIVLASSLSGNSQAALDLQGSGSSLTAPAELVQVSAENLRFSRLLKDTANVLQFSSISNDAPPIWGIPRDGKKEGTREKKGSRKLGGSASPAGPNFGRRALDYDEQVSLGLEESTSESKIIANPYPGNEYVYVRPGKLLQQVLGEEPSVIDPTASVTSINNKPPRVPLAILRQKKGKRVNITPLFTEVPEVTQHDSGKEFVWVDQKPPAIVGVNRQGRKQSDAEEITTNPAFGEEDIEATTLSDDIPIETTTLKQKLKPKSKTIVNIVTSEPRFSVESSVGERRSGKGSRKLKTTTASSVSTRTAAATSSSSTTTESVPETTTITTPTTTFRVVVPSATPSSPTILSSSSARAIASAADLKENLVTDASHRTGSFQGFHDSSQTRFQAAESSQPARVNVRPAQNGKEYEYEYIYYYYDDDDEAANGGEKQRGEAQTKAIENTKDVKKVSTPESSTTTLSTPGSSSSSSSSSSSASPQTSSTSSVTSSTTSTTTLSPIVSSAADADFEYEDDAELDEDKLSSPLPEIQKSTPQATRVAEEPIVTKGVSSAEKISNSNPINQLDRSRGPKILPGKFEEAAADYKLETEASQEEEVVQTHSLSRGQPQRQHTTPVEEDEEDDAEDHVQVFHSSSREPSTSSPAGSTTSEFDISHMSTLAKTHKDSINTPIILKQSNLLKSVPVSQLQPHQVEVGSEQPQTTVYTVTQAPPTTTAPTTTTVATSSEPAPSTPGRPRFRGHHNRLRANNTPRPASSTTTTGNAEKQPSEEKPAQAIHRPNLRGNPRRNQSRRPVQQEAKETADELQPAASPVIENHARPLPIRPRFPPRNGGLHQTSTAASPAPSSDAPPAAVTVSAVELNSLEDKKKDAHVRAKSASDLFAFARLQQAISSRAPSRKQLVAGFVNSGEVTTESITSSEVTTVSSLGGQSSESVTDDTPSSTTTTTTTTEAVQLDKYGRQRGRFGGRTRRPLGGGSGSTSTTEAPSTQRSRFGGARRRTSTTEAPGSEGSASPSNQDSETPKPRIPARNRFASRNRVSTSTTESSVTTSEGQKKATESERPAQPVGPGGRRRPGAFGGRRRPNHVQQQTQTEAPAATPADQDGETNQTGTEASTPTITSTAAPATPGRNRFNLPGARPRPGGNRIRPGGRLRGPTSTTTEAAPETQPDAPDQTEPEQSQSIQNENVEQAVQSTPAAPESVVPIKGSGGVLGRLKNRPKLVVTTPVPEAADKKPRLGGLLNRRKSLGQLTAAAVKEEVRETVSEGAEEANNHALEQTDDDHRGVVVQVSSSVTESEEVNEAAGEVLEPSSTTPASILNRLKSQRKPGSLFRKKPDPHGE